MVTSKQADPLAVALANASLLSAGYVMLGRRKLAFGTGVVTITLVSVLAMIVRTLWFEFVVFGWWAAMVAHGLFLSRGGGGSRRQRLIALAFTMPVLLVFGLLRFDAARIDANAAETHGRGDCPATLAELDGLWAGHHVADAPLTVRAEQTTRACRLLLAAEEQLDQSLGGDVEPLEHGFATLTAVRRIDGQDQRIREVLDRFTSHLSPGGGCDTAAITDWLRQYARGPVLDQAAAVVPRVAPGALLLCADMLMQSDDWPEARDRYRQLVAAYPGHELAARATEGADRATREIELANVRDLLDVSYSGGEPEYCDSPAPYSFAAPYGDGPNRALVFGDDDTLDRFPGEWRAGGPEDAVAIVCVGESDYGVPVETCTYRSQTAAAIVGDTTFHRIALPVRVYELKTGRLVSDTRIEISGGSCPEVLRHSSYLTPIGPPSQVYVTPSDGDIRVAFQPLIDP
ncbi:hypothetical protein GCM10027445_61280 [Amycolatopsis endophytica]|uniref:Uncharacterized protein n=1 Tax=Amycolatopsis endophytica TaxID=860233 RepID=A0A853B6P6_9PSEU|nr:hypothetical protein [Amycolatopsis endophytica]NYI90482.1 hypothetical protein [Amycolatopsis endophytica]